MPDPVVVDRVTKRFAGHTAVDTLSLTVPSGIIYGLLGPNGAGKSTTIRMILNIYVPDSGSVRLFGEQGSGRDHSARIGYLPEEPWLERLGLSDWRMRKVNELSKGMQQKVQFISTILHDPDLLVMDEAFSGLDPVNSQVLKDTVLELRAQGKTILFSTHIMEQAEKICDHVCIIARGKKLVDGTLSDLKRTHGGRHLLVNFDGARGTADAIFADRHLVAKADASGQFAELELAAQADAQEILRALVTSGARLSRFELAEPSLNKIFIDLVGPDAATPVARPEVAHA